ncbi:MAG: CPBP family intramembrane metalloprotease [Actinomycetota bacterium]|nr:CPBP family intramembrane metalloprotease [Actinomycetota bacterium]
MIETTGSERSDARLGFWLATVGFVAALGYASRFAGDNRPDRTVLYEWTTAIGGAVQFGIFLAIAIAISGGSRARLGLRRPRSWRRALGLAAFAFFACWIGLGLLDRIVQGGQEQGLTPDRWDPSRAAQFAANFVVIAVLAPVVEELLFRGIGFHLLARFGTTAAILGTGLAFGLYHGLLNALPILALFGVALGWLRARTNSVYPGILVHAAFNSVALIVSVTING